MMNPLHAGDAYVSRDTTTARKTACRPISVMPWCRYDWPCNHHVIDLQQTETDTTTSGITRPRKGKGSPYSITERRVPELIPVLGSQPAGDVTYKPGGRLPLLSARPAVIPEGCYKFRYRGTMGVSSLPKTVDRQRRGCDLNLGPSAPESSTLTTRLPSHPVTRPPAENTSA